MPAAQAASRTPGTRGISGNRSGAKGETFAALAMMSSSDSLVSQRLAFATARDRSLFRPGARALALHGALELRIDVLDLSLAPQVRRYLLSLLVDHGSHDPLLDRLESRSRTLAAVIDPYDVPAELALERLADLTLFQAEGYLLERRYHLPASEESELAPLVLRSRVLGV